MTSRSLALLTSLLVALAGLPVGAAEPAPATGDPVTVIAEFHATLLDVMKKSKSLRVRGRYARLEPAVKETFSLPVMIRIAAGSHWAKGSEAARERLTTAFERMSVATYADRFDGYSGESFETVGRRPGPQGTMLVETKLLRPKDDPVAIAYVMREVQARWRVIDVLLESGISELARYRSDYAKILRDRGLEGLIAELDARSERMLDSDSAGRR